MAFHPRIPSNVPLNCSALFLALTLTHQVVAYDSPLSTQAIREAYSIGQRHDADFLSRYKRAIPILNEKEGGCISSVRLETPFLQVVAFADNAPNYSMQDAVKHFYGKSLPLRIHLDICYMSSAPPPGSLKIRILQNKGLVLPVSDDRSAYVPVVDTRWTLPANGEQIDLEFLAEKISSATLTIQIDTPNDQHAEIDLDLPALR
jgi:hypothetical protein